MAPYNPMKKHMDKLDEWGASQSKKFTSSRDAGPGASVTDRFNLARGKDDRWERTKTTASTGEDESNIVPQRASASRLSSLPPSAPSYVGGSKAAAPPPPPQRGGAPPPPPARGKAPPPPLPRRMDNEAGTDRPPPAYGSTSSPAIHTAPASSTAVPDYIEFSKFTEDDKQAFFALLDEFFASRTSSSSFGKLATQNGRRGRSADDTPLVQTKATKQPAKPSGPEPKASRFEAPKGGTPLPPNSSAAHYSHLSASSIDVNEQCTALTCATFLCYPDSYPEWSGPNPWFVKPNAVPQSIAGRTDVAYSVSSMYSGKDHTLRGGALFADLSCLWWNICWKSSNPSGTVKSQVAYRKPPSAWNDSERLVEASKGFGDWIAGFAETQAANRTPVGDGECWTLAAEAIKYTNGTARLTEANRLMNTIGRTHGFLLFGGKADEVNGQCGRWRGGDRISSLGGGVRRGDIVEWKSAKCRIKGSAPGSYVTLGAPEHTAVIVEDSPVPARLEQRGKARGGNDDGDLYSVLGVARNASQAEIRAAYLQGARRHHPDKQDGPGNDYIQRLNEAHGTLADPSLRSRYDEHLRGQGSKSNTARVTATVDLDAFEVVESQSSSSPDGVVSFCYPCRCGNGFYIDGEQLEDGRDLVACSGCSEQIRVVWQDGPVHQGGNSEEAEGDDDSEQPSLAPWELGSITTIEQSAGQPPTRNTYDLGRDSFTRGEMWIYRPVWEAEYLGGPVTASWPPSLSGWEQLQ